MKRLVFLACLTLSCLSADTAHAIAPPGWASGGSPSTPYKQQILSDVQNAAKECSENSALLFRIRGSGATYGDGVGKGEDKLGRWSSALGGALIQRGWSVRDMQATYNAPPVPFDEIAANFKKADESRLILRPAAIALAIARSAAALKDYRDVATKEWSNVAAQLEKASARCPSAKIAIAAYSQGGIVSRYLIRDFIPRLRSRIARVDLIADPTADSRSDGNLDHKGAPSARATGAGIDTFFARFGHPGFIQAPYPGDVAHRVTQYCLPYDMVCDANLVSFVAKGEGARHASYPWEQIGLATAKAFRVWQSGTSPGTSPGGPAGGGPPPSGSTGGMRITAGGFHTCGLRSDGTAVCWGDNSSGQASPPSGTFTQLSAGGYHTCGLRSDGTAACWGDNGSGQASPPAGTFTQLSAGSYSFHTCGLRSDGTAACWGYNGSGQASPPGGTFTQLSAGAEHTCGLRSDGTAACWGYNKYGQASPPGGTFN